MLSWRVARNVSGILATTALAVGLLAPVPAQADGMQVVGDPSARSGEDVASSTTPAEPAKVTQRSIPTRPSAEREPAPRRLAEHSADATVVAELDADRLAPFSMLGVTWEGGLEDSATHIEVRWRSDGTWSEWTELHADPAPEEEGRSGTEPQWVGTADGAQVRVASAPDSAPKGLALSTIDPAADAEGAGTAVDPAVAVTPAASVSKPSIVSRSGWGANSSGSCDSPIYGSTTRGAVIHHTAGNNSYSRSQSAAIVKATQAYHMKSRKWCDIGYNFLVDKYGQIFEGRAGGVTKPVRAAHSGNLAVNKETMGVSLMGTFATVAPSAAMKSAVVDLVSWRFAQQGLKAKGTYSLGGLKLNRIAGHRNVVSTECPGAAAYGWLSAKGGLRDSVEDRLAGGGSASGTIAGRAVTDVTATGFTLSWTALSKAATYEVVVSSRQEGPTECADGCTSQKATSSPRATITGLSAGSTQYAWVRALDSSGRPLTTWQSTPKTVKLVKTPAAKPSTVSGLTIKAGTHSARLRWPAVVGATSYDLCVVKDRADSSCYRYVSALKDVTYLVKDLKPTAKTDFFVKLRAANGSAKSGWSAFKGFNLATSTPAASATTATVPSSGRVTVKGHGYGHGIGMSQHGAYGAAKQGIAHDKILARYYPGTKLATTSGSIRVLVSQDTTDSVDIAGRAGLKLRKLAGGTTTLPRSISGNNVTRWRIVQVSTKKTQSTLQYRTTGGWKTYKSMRWTGDAQFEGTSMIALVMPDGSLARYRGALRSALPSKGSTSRNTVNVLPIDDYVRGVVAAEMPSSWSAEALKAQSVAARTYGVRSKSASRYYDICSTTSCQVYGGVARETATTDAAVAGTKGKILTYDGAPALTQFSSSSGGYTAVGSQPYLKAVADPWDDFSGNPHHSWSTTVAATTVQKAYPSIGTLKSLKITKRTGQGDWGGRVASINLVGSSRTVTITGNDARWALGLKSAWFGF